MAKVTSSKLSDGKMIPDLGLGTWLSKPGEVQAAVKFAVANGYRLIDCAYCYGNEGEVGSALKDILSEGAVKREELIITSKLWNTRHSAADVKASVEESLGLLGVDYIDLYFIHWPHAFKPGKDMFPKDESGKLIYADIHYMEAYKALEKCYDEGLIKSIGLSNFNSLQIQDVLDNSRVKPVSIQVEIHPYFSQEKLVGFCQKRGLHLMAYSPLGAPTRPWVTSSDPVILEDEQIKSIASKHKKSPAQVILRWHIQRSICPIPKSVTPARITQNLDVFDFELSDDELSVMNGFDKNCRLICPLVEVNGKMVPRDGLAPYYPFQDDIEF